MKIKLRKNPDSCQEMSEFIGYEVESLTRHSDGSIKEIDIKEELNPGELMLLIQKLEQASFHLIEDDTPEEE